MTLSRSSTDRWLGGVCAGIARYFGWDTSTTRLIVALSIIFFGSGLLVYLALWILMPLERAL